MRVRGLSYKVYEASKRLYDGTLCNQIILLISDVPLRQCPIQPASHCRGSPFYPIRSTLLQIRRESSVLKDVTTQRNIRRASL